MWMDVVAPKDPDDVSVSEEAKRKYVCVGINQSANKEQQSIDSLLPKEEAFYDQESSDSPVYNQTSESNKNECTELAIDLLLERMEPSLEKARVYLQNL